MLFSPSSCDLHHPRLGKPRWDITALDVFMPVRSGLEVLHEVRQNHPRLRMLVLGSALVRLSACIGNLIRPASAVHQWPFLIARPRGAGTEARTPPINKE